MKLSFVIVTYNRGPLLQACLNSIYQQTGLVRPFEIIVIDNGGSAEIVPPDDPEIHLRIERRGSNLGAAGGRNLAMSLASGEYLISLDDDAAWTQNDAVVKLISHLEADPSLGAVSARTIDINGTLIRVDLPHPNKRYISSAIAPVEIPYFYTVGLAIRAEVIAKVGNYPERYGIYFEEPDLSLRVLDAGYTILYDPTVIVLHHRSQNGRPIIGDAYWKQSALNKSRMAWRLLPQPYPITTMIVWSIAVAFKTKKLSCVLGVWRNLWAERALLASERKPIRPETVRYLKRIGARFLY